MWTLTELHNLGKVKELIEAGEYKLALDVVNARIGEILNEQEEEANVVARMAKLNEDIKEVKGSLRKIEVIDGLIKRIDLILEKGS